MEKDAAGCCKCFEYYLFLHLSFHFLICIGWMFHYKAIGMEVWFIIRGQLLGFAMVVRLPFAYLSTYKPFTIRVPLESIVCYSHIFKKNLWIKQKYANYLKDSCCLPSDQHFSFKSFPKNALLSKIFPKSSGLFSSMWVWMD